MAYGAPPPFQEFMLFNPWDKRYGRERNIVILSLRRNPQGFIR